MRSPTTQGNLKVVPPHPQGGLRLTVIIHADWKRLKIAHFQKEEARFKDYAETRPWPKNQFDFWGYAFRPSRIPPSFDFHINWVYIVDLDDCMFTVAESVKSKRQFRLDNIPRWLFEDSSDCGGVMTAAVPTEYLAEFRTVAGPDMGLVAFYMTCSPKIQPMYETLQKEQFSAPQTLRLALLNQFVERFSTTFQDLGSSTGKDSFSFRQLTYAILSLCNIGADVRLKRERLWWNYNKVIGTESEATLDYDIPDAATYWLNDVLVVLEPRIHAQQYLHAAIGRAIKKAQPKHRPTVVTIICSLDLVVLANINTNPAGTYVVHTRNLLLCPENELGRKWTTLESHPTEGIVALFELFVTHLPAPTSFPGGLPTELCYDLFNFCEPSTKLSLASTCRLFRRIASEQLTLEGWTLLRPWGHNDANFVALPGPCVVVLMESLKVTCDGLKVCLFSGRYSLELKLPLLSISKTDNEGYPGCECCLGLENSAP